MSDTPKIPLVSILIPVLNRPKDIALCIESLFKLDFPKDDYEIIVVDNNSTDNTKAVIQKYPVKYVFEAKRGRGSARNAGVKASTGKYLAFIDSDCIATPHWLTELVKFMEANPRIAACGGKVVAHKSEGIIERYFDAQSILDQKLALSSAEKGHGLPRFVTANAVIRKGIVEDLGGFDNRMFTGEDTDLSWRLALNGYQTKYVDTAIVYHKHITNHLKFIQHRFEYGRSYYLKLKKYSGFMFAEPFYRPKFLSRLIVQFVNLPCLFFMMRNKFSGKRNSLALIATVDAMLSNLGTLFVFVLDWLHLISLPYPKFNPDMEKAINKSSVIVKNGLLFRPATNVIWFISNDLIRFMNIRSHIIYQLNETSSRIWQVLCETGDFSRTVTIISGEYQIPEGEVCGDAQELFDQLEKEKLILKDG